MSVRKYTRHMFTNRTVSYRKRCAFRIFNVTLRTKHWIYKLWKRTTNRYTRLDHRLRIIPRSDINTFLFFLSLLMFKNRSSPVHQLEIDSLKHKTVVTILHYVRQYSSSNMFMSYKIVPYGKYARARIHTDIHFPCCTTLYDINMLYVECCRA